MSTFNAIHYEQELTNAGVGKEQAAVHAKALGQVMTEVVFCSDLKKVESNLRGEIEQSAQRLADRMDSKCTELSAKIEAVRAELNAKIEIVRADLSAKIDKLEARIGALEYELAVHRWLFGLVIALQMGTLAAVIKLLVP
ncbi:hypothetical protein [Massilia sp. CF038]|uniref:hypothetical protein n=1 Tax=Massilia sp. CF038 TaxID=1881045 RepID=UPI00091DC59D|nr:hypothetical protein [Massilia sp. CF038]SHH55117.1 hypothetical protein SAMN05428948_4416 [Massilia sp. CF038]